MLLCLCSHKQLAITHTVISFVLDRTANGARPSCHDGELFQIGSRVQVVDPAYASPSPTFFCLLISQPKLIIVISDTIGGTLLQGWLNFEPLKKSVICDLDSGTTKVTAELVRKVYRTGGGKTLTLSWPNVVVTKFHQNVRATYTGFDSYMRPNVRIFYENVVNLNRLTFVCE